jgi:hypothetical protein
LKGLWKLCARMFRIVSDTLSDIVSDAGAVSVVLKGVPYGCAISCAAGRDTPCGTPCGSSVVSSEWFLVDIREYTPGFQMVYEEGSAAMWEWFCERSGMICKGCARTPVSSAAGGRMPLRADSPRALSCHAKRPRVTPNTPFGWCERLFGYNCGTPLFIWSRRYYRILLYICL